MPLNEILLDIAVVNCSAEELRAMKYLIEWIGFIWISVIFYQVISGKSLSGDKENCSLLYLEKKKEDCFLLLTCGYVCFVNHRVISAPLKPEREDEKVKSQTKTRVIFKIAHTKYYEQFFFVFFFVFSLMYLFSCWTWQAVWLISLSLSRVGVESNRGGTPMKMGCMAQPAPYHPVETSRTSSKWRTKSGASSTSHPLHSTRQLVDSAGSGSLADL